MSGATTSIHQIAHPIRRRNVTLGRRLLPAHALQHNRQAPNVPQSLLKPDNVMLAALQPVNVLALRQSRPPPLFRPRRLHRVIIHEIDINTKSHYAEGMLLRVLRTANPEFKPKTALRYENAPRNHPPVTRQRSQTRASLRISPCRVTQKLAGKTKNKYGQRRKNQKMGQTSRRIRASAPRPGFGCKPPAPVLVATASRRCDANRLSTLNPHPCVTRAPKRAAQPQQIRRFPRTDHLTAKQMLALCVTRERLHREAACGIDLPRRRRESTCHRPFLCQPRRCAAGRGRRSAVSHNVLRHRLGRSP